MSNDLNHSSDIRNYRHAYTQGLAARLGQKLAIQSLNDRDGVVDSASLLGMYEGAALLPPRLGENVFEEPRRIAVAAHPGRGRRGCRGRERERDRERSASLRQAREPSSKEKEERFMRDVQLAEVIRQVRTMQAAHPTVFANPAIAKAFTDAVKTVTAVFEEGQR